MSGYAPRLGLNHHHTSRTVFGLPPISVLVAKHKIQKGTPDDLIRTQTGLPVRPRLELRATP